MRTCAAFITSAAGATHAASVTPAASAAAEQDIKTVSNKSKQGLIPEAVQQKG